VKTHAYDRSIVLSLLLCAGLVALGLHFTVITRAGQSHAPSAASPLAPANPGPDLIIQSITVTPAYPGPGQPVNIEIVIKNVGDAKATPVGDLIITALYVDLHREPQLGDLDTSYTGLFSLDAGRSYVWTYKNYDKFTTVGCDHDIWAWTDRGSNVIEDNENNNKLSIQVCVGTTPTPTSSPTRSPTPTLTPTATSTPTRTPTPCVPDPYEAGGDDACTGASPISLDGVHQMHNLCPVGDEDWVQFTAQQGITYTLSTANVGADGDTMLLLYNRCAQPTPSASSDPAFGNGVDLVFEAPESGIYYLKVKHHDAAYGAATDYELIITPSTTCQGDAQEADDSCATARDLTVGATGVVRQFCRPADADWVKFTAASGATYSAEATGVGPDAHPVFQVFDQCGYAAALAEGQPTSWTAPSSGTYYLRMTNQDPNVFGATTQYRATVQMTACGPDAYEPDGDSAHAHTLTPGGPEQIHDACPASDQDWLKFTATAGQLYVIETYELGPDADTKICLFNTNGASQIACDDDSGGGLASRLRWTAPGDGTYYLRIKHTVASISGPTTSYHVAISVGDPLDSYEPDNSPAQAAPIGTDGAAQKHNFTPNGDQDWVKFTVDSTTLPYTIQTDKLSGDSDTILHLIALDGATELTSNDDYGGSERSLITYIFPSPGAYYARVHHYRTNRSGLGTQYELSVTKNYQPPTATPTPTVPAPPGPTSTPSASGIRTLIVTNRERLVALYGETKAQSVMDRLALLASDTRVRGLILQAQNDASAATAYTFWNSTPISTTLANNTASAVRSMILAALNTNPGVEYIVLVGNDRVVPFRRTLDRTKYPENYYQAAVTGNTSIWAACRDQMSLTDDYYADREPYIVNGQEVYVPDFALGRLPEGADEIVAFVDSYLAGGIINLQKVLVTGYDFVVDTAQTVANNIVSDLGPDGSIDSSLQGDWWTAAALQNLQLQTSPPFNVQFINGHASHHLQGAPAGGGVHDATVVSSTGNDLNRALIVTLGCHSGLNDITPTGAPGAALDLAEAFFKRGANYIANTGYGWGSNAGLGWSERLVHNYVAAFTQGASTTIGKAMMTAKQRYWNESVAFDAYDEKALMESTLYGLPHFQLVSGGLLGPEDPFPSVVITPSMPLNGGPVKIGGLDFSLQGALGALEQHQTPLGTFYDINGNTDLAAGQPMQPGFYSNVTHAPAGRVHGVTMDSAHYADLGVLNPVIAQPSNEWDNDWAEPPFTSEGWWPPRPLSLQGVAAGRAFTDTVLTQLGQYNGQTGAQRLYDGMSMSVYYSTSPDWTPPEITYVGERVEASGGSAIVKVGARDLSGILGGLVTYTQGDGKWHSQALAYHPATDKWTAQVPATTPARYFVQIVDKAGNVAVADNKGRYYELPGHNTTYLPLILKTR
jgi:hypothetical protein